MSDSITNTIENERSVGFKDIFIASVFQNDAQAYSVSNTVELARAISGKLTEKTTTTTYYSNDTIESVNTSITGVTLELEVNALSPMMQSTILGKKLINGILATNSQDIANQTAISFRIKNTKGLYEFYQMYDVVFETEGKSFKTLADKEKDETIKIKGTCTPMVKTGDYYITVNEQYLLDADTNAKAAIATWSSKVQIRSDITNPLSTSKPITA